MDFIVGNEQSKEKVSKNQSSLFDIIFVQSILLTETLIQA